MSENTNENVNVSPVIDEDTAQKLGEASLNRIKMFGKMCKEYVRATNNGHINSLEMFQTGIDMIVAGFGLISRSNDMDELGVDERIRNINAALTTVINLLNKVYLNPDVVANQVAQAAVESAQRKGIGADKIEKMFGGKSE